MDNKELEKGIPLDGIASGGVGIVLSRMDSHPEEFWSECEKWRFIYKDYFRDAMTEAEKGMIFDKMKKIRKEEFNHLVLKNLVDIANEPEEAEEDDDDPFGYAPVKREGSTVKYDSMNRYRWGKK